MSVRTIFVVEDDSAICQGLCTLLERNGYRAYAANGFEGLASQIVGSGADLVLLDLNLPGVDGSYVIREVRTQAVTPIIAVTSRNTDLDELVCLSAGADDFVPKPYNEQVLLAHIDAVLKRTYGTNEAASRLSHAGLVLDTARCTASYQGNSVELTKNELRILSLLLRSAGAVVSRQRIQEELWETDDFVDDNTLTVNVSHLRATLASIGAGNLIVTRRGFGYVIE